VSTGALHRAGLRNVLTVGSMTSRPVAGRPSVAALTMVRRVHRSVLIIPRLSPD